MKFHEFRLKFHWSLFLVRVQLTIFHHWFRRWLGAHQATIYYLNKWWLVYWRIYASFDLVELTHWLVVQLPGRAPHWSYSLKQFAPKIPLVLCHFKCVSTPRAASLQCAKDALAQPHAEPTKSICRFRKISLLPTYENIPAVINIKLHLPYQGNACCVYNKSW